MNLSTLETLTVCFEADASALFAGLDTVQSRIDELRNGRVQAFPAMGDIQMQLSVTADEAISRALADAGSTLSAAVLSHEAQFSSALGASQQALASALQSAARQMGSSIHISVPVTISGQRVAEATGKYINQKTLQSGMLQR